ncbi:DAK2 domain-containing protein [uncultured Nocardioides sp.]|uniref:DAK2 domain-containing protein n=1 Tax=uncultured Nocardioides sp. TaxID=198441 RepID=UPI00262E8F69|nr:DAK2 domain-containing protein [uncultured Nocardioides sp.]
MFRRRAPVRPEPDLPLSTFQARRLYHLVADAFAQAGVVVEVFGDHAVDERGRAYGLRDLAAAWTAAAKASTEAAAATADLPPRMGRARTHGEHSMGTPDPGAHSLALIASAVGASNPEGVEIDGIDLLPLATGQAADNRPRTLFWQSGYYRIVRQGDWKLQVSKRPEKKWLYNLADDHTEQRNLAQERPDKVTELLALIKQHEASARPPLYPYVAEMPVAVDKTLAEEFVPGDEYIYWPN